MPKIRKMNVKIKDFATIQKLLSNMMQISYDIILNSYNIGIITILRFQFSIDIISETYKNF